MSREDLSNSVVHLCKGDKAKDTLWQILRDRRVNPSMRREVKRADPLGAACFYDAPRRLDELIATNPNDRRGYGILVAKDDFWKVGGRPAIYTDGTFDGWPDGERFRLIFTCLEQGPRWADWMHEREWRTRGPLELSHALAWQPLVPTRSDAVELIAAFPDLEFVSAVERNGLFEASGGDIVAEWDEDNPLLTDEELRKLEAEVEEERRAWEREDEEQRAKVRPVRTPSGELVCTSTGYLGKAGDILQSTNEPRLFWRVLEFGDSISVEEISEEVARREAKPPEYPPYLEFVYEGGMVKGDELTRILTERIREGR